VVILGQDPYPTPGHPMGLAFSVRPSVTPLPASLRNIYKELEADLGIAPAPHGCLQAWAEQGVFLLNAALSVRAGAAGSHARLGWEQVTDAAIRALSERRRGLVFLLWGKAAEAKAALVDEAAHAVLRAPHPSPLSARRGFFGCRHFSQANAYLEARGVEPIAWALPSRPRTEQAAAQVARASRSPQAAAKLAPPPPPPPPPSSPPPPPPPPPSSSPPAAGGRLSERLVLVFDTETTGLDVETARVVQLGASYWRGGVQLGPRRGMLVDPGVPIPPETSAVHGVTDERVAGAPSFAEVGARFARHLRGEAEPTAGGLPPLLCGYNALEYDVPLLNAEMARHGLPERVDTAAVLDPMVWLRYHRRHWPSHKLVAVAKRYEYSLVDAHSASADAAATGAVLGGMVAEGLIPDDVGAALEEQAPPPCAEPPAAPWGPCARAPRERPPSSGALPRERHIPHLSEPGAAARSARRRGGALQLLPVHRPRRRRDAEAGLRQACGRAPTRGRALVLAACARLRQPASSCRRRDA
jgi:uracil-DNA glycosylase